MSTIHPAGFPDGPNRRQTLAGSRLSTTSTSDLRVLFRAAAGPRRGFGHLVRSISLARALGVRPLMCLRGPAEAVDTALSLGADVLTDGAPRSIATLGPDVVVIDDPVASATRRWIAAARRCGAVVVTVHHHRVLVAHGDESRRPVAMAVAEAIAAADPRAQVHVAASFAAGAAPRPGTVPWTGAAAARNLARVASPVPFSPRGATAYGAHPAGTRTVTGTSGQAATALMLPPQGAIVGAAPEPSLRLVTRAPIALLQYSRREEVLARHAAQLTHADASRGGVVPFVAKSRP